MDDLARIGRRSKQLLCVALRYLQLFGSLALNVSIFRRDLLLAVNHRRVEQIQSMKLTLHKFVLRVLTRERFELLGLRHIQLGSSGSRSLHRVAFLLSRYLNGGKLFGLLRRETFSEQGCGVGLLFSVSGGGFSDYLGLISV